MRLWMLAVLLGIVCIAALRTEGQGITHSSVCGARQYVSCGQQGPVSTCTAASRVWRLQTQSGATLLPSQSAWHYINSTTCDLTLLDVASQDVGTYTCCAGGFIGVDSCPSSLHMVNVTLASGSGPCVRVVTTSEAMAATATTQIRRPSTTSAASSSSLTMTELILIIAASVLVVVITFASTFVCYQKYSLGKLRSSHREQLSIHAPADHGRKSAFQQSVNSELSAANITPNAPMIPAKEKRRNRKRGMQHSMSEPRLQKSMYGTKPGFMSSGLMGFDQLNTPSAYSIQSKDVRGFHNNYYGQLQMQRGGNDDLGDIDDLVRRVGASPSTPTKPLSTSEPLEENVDESDSVPSLGPRLVRHYSWHTPGGGFSATMKSGEEVTSPFAHFVSKRMARHRSSVRSPVHDSSAPLTEEELEDMLASDPEMSAVEHDTGTEDYDGYSDS